jgi:hypothetical protein
MNWKWSRLRTGLGVTRQAECSEGGMSGRKVCDRVVAFMWYWWVNKARQDNCETTKSRLDASESTVVIYLNWEDDKGE